MKSPQLTVAILTKNAQETIESTLQSIPADTRITALDDASTDQTIKILQKHDVEIIPRIDGDFAQKRNALLQACQTKWIFYLDSDEIISQELAAKIFSISQTDKPACFRIKRRNFFLSTEMYADYVDRLFHTSVIRGWTGKVHESPTITGHLHILEETLIHYTHRDITSMLAKTNEWSEYEAKLRIDARHPMMQWWRLVRIGLTTFWENYFGKQLFKYGRTGLFEAYFQVVDKLIVYTKLWEKQH